MGRPPRASRCPLGPNPPHGLWFLLNLCGLRPPLPFALAPRQLTLRSYSVDLKVVALLGMVVLDFPSGSRKVTDF